MEIIRGKILSGQKVVIYGPEGIGKTTLAACFPNPVFIDTEGSTKHFDVARLPAPTSWEMLKSEVQWAISNPKELGTLVIDTADWADKLCARAVCQRAGKSGIEDFGYGKGYVYQGEEFGRLLDLLDRVTSLGVHVILTAHATLRKVELPDDMGAYDKYEMKMSKQVSPIVKEWADLVLFCNYKTIVVKSESGKGKAQGGKRMMYATHHTCWDAKNRHGLPDAMPMEYGPIAHLFVQSGPTAAPVEPIEQVVSAREEKPENPIPAEIAAATGPEAQTPPPAAQVASISEPQPVPELEEQLQQIYPPLADLMRSDQITPGELQLCVNDRLQGCFPPDMPPEAYPQDFLDQWVIPNWEHIKNWVWNDRQLPF